MVFRVPNLPRPELHHSGQSKFRAFELVVCVVGAYDATFTCLLDKHFAGRCVRNNKALLHSTCVVEKDFYFFVMRDWEATAAVLNDIGNSMSTPSEIDCFAIYDQ